MTATPDRRRRRRGGAGEPASPGAPGGVVVRPWSDMGWLLSYVLDDRGVRATMKPAGRAHTGRSRAQSRDTPSRFAAGLRAAPLVHEATLEAFAARRCHPGHTATARRARTAIRRAAIRIEPPKRRAPRDDPHRAGAAILASGLRAPQRMVTHRDGPPSATSYRSNSSVVGAQRRDQRRRLAAASASLRPEPDSLGGTAVLRERFDAGTGLVALGAVVLLVSLFVDWYDPSGDAWTVFETVDLLLAGAAIACLVAVVPRYAALQRAVPVIAFAALFVVVVQIVDPPPSAARDQIEAGAWLALAGTALMAAGATLSAASISVTVDVRGRDRRRRSAAIDARERELAETEAMPDPEPYAPPARRRANPTDVPAPFDAEAPRRRPAADDDEPGPAPHASDPPTAVDPDRTQALDPVDPPREAP